MDPYYFWDVSLFQIHEIHPVDLIDMHNQKVEYEGRCYQYVLSLRDVFSRFHWLVTFYYYYYYYAKYTYILL